MAAPASPLPVHGGEAGEGRGILASKRHFVVYDPVMVASSGDALSGEDFVAAIRARLLPLVDCLTPDLPEAAALLGARRRERSRDDEQGEALLALGPRAVLMKGGHLDDDMRSIC